MRILMVFLVLLICGCQSSDTENVADFQTRWPPSGDAMSVSYSDAAFPSDAAVNAPVTVIDAHTDTNTNTNTSIVIESDAASNTDAHLDGKVQMGIDANMGTDSTDTGVNTNTDAGRTDTSPPATTATELVEQIRIGWNLGNSLDAPEGETSWGNPVTTEALIQAVAAQGFRVIRVPVTWSLHMGAGPDFRIDSSWMDRVEEVVNTVLNNGMYAIINLHHDGADDYESVEWITLNDPFGGITNENNAAVEARFVKVWEQIAARFMNHDEHLIFESMNEIHDGYDAPNSVYYDIINNLNQVFVNTIRASGGKNATRYLVVPGYNTNIEYTLAGFVRPNDNAPNRLILSVHYYDPWSFAGEGSTRVWGAAYPGSDNWGQEDYVQTQFGQLRAKFGDNGLPIMMGEYGAVNISGAESYRRYYMEYVTKAARDNGIVPIYWDNGGTGSGKDNFGLFDRNSASLLYPDVVDAMMRAVFDDYTINDIVAP